MNEHNPECGETNKNTENLARKGIEDQPNGYAPESNPAYKYPEDEFEEEMRGFWRYLRGGWSALHFDKRIEILLGLFGLLVVIIYTTYTAMMYKANRDAANAASAAVTVARDTLTDTQQTNKQQRLDNIAAALDAKRLADKNSAQAAKSLQATIDNFHLDQRAWFGIGNPILTFNERVPFEFSVEGKNVGKTPAIQTHLQISWLWKRSSEAFTLSDIVYPRKSENVGDINPGAYLPIFQKGKEVTPDQIVVLNYLRSGVLTMYVFAEVTYSDIFMKPHWIHMCMIVNKDLTHAHYCDIYNDADKN